MSLDEVPVCGSSSIGGTNGVCNGRSRVPSLWIRRKIPSSVTISLAMVGVVEAISVQGTEKSAWNTEEYDFSGEK